MSTVKNRRNTGDSSDKDDREIQMLQQELQALRNIRSSLHAVECMVKCVNQKTTIQEIALNKGLPNVNNIQLAIKNGDNLAELNKGWQIFFTGQK